MIDAPAASFVRGLDQALLSNPKALNPKETLSPVCHGDAPAAEGFRQVLSCCPAADAVALGDKLPEKHACSGTARGEGISWRRSWS